MATYSTDLTTRDTADTATNWVELTGTIGGFSLNGAGSPALDNENFIQGVDCVSQTTGKAVDAEISISYDHGANLTFTAGHVVFHWCFYAVGVNLKTTANDGWMYTICDSLTTGNYYTFGGSDSGRNPYGGWTNVAIDPTATATGTLGAGGNSGNYRYFGHVCNTIGEISKGTPSAVDAIRTGRGQISITGTGGSFSELASYNDYNAGGTPPGTSSTSIDTGRHRLGLFQGAAGTYLWKGLMSQGLSGTSVTFSDSNETIIIDDCPHTYPSFNKIEINNASSSVTWNNITFISTASTVNGRGYFEMIDNATVNLLGCSFNKMGTFIFQSNGTVTGCNFNGCQQVTHGGATFFGSNFAGYEGTAGTGAVLYNVAADPNGELDECDFAMGATSTHAIQFGTSAPATMTLTGLSFTGYNTTNGDAGTANDAVLYFPDKGTDTTWTVNAVGCNGTISYKKARAGDTVTIVSDPVTILVKATDSETGGNIQNARALVWVTSGVNFPYQASVSITGTGTTATVTHTAHGLATNDNVIIEGVDQDVYNGAYTITVTGVNTYTYTTNETIASSPATGTPISTFAFINALTDINGEASDSRVVSTNQPVNFRVRKHDTSPFYRQSNGSRIVNNTTGLDIAVGLVSDE